ncbi:zinc carboxypeptidase [Emericellopsis atlantica]|uniref:Inactive metallocarboxypeptidase ECM14 n=1 Tax=Emericellopsis atlantica TaxID=2614577 RepID=A0A9P7ZEC0_9HYPO|nr:zinc carboxypeptidase [Emericellopsis atlantica]KAG9250376.1 zinc carboxypeptidase [Emericellopsis atlantica]
MKLGVAACVAPLLFASAVSSIGTGPQTESRATSVHGNTRLFPWLTKLRDGTVEAIFGRHPHKPAVVPGPIRAQYADQLVLRLNLSSAADEEALGRAVDRLFLDVWSYTQDYVDIRLGKNEVKPLLGLLPQTLHSSYSVLIPDLAAAVYRSQSSSELEQTITPETIYADLESSETPAVRAGENLFFQDYQPLPVIIRWMRLLEAMFPSYVRYITIGKSFEDRDIPALRVGLPVAPGTATARKTIVVTGGLHGREWISTTSVNYLAWAFITSFGKEPMITKLLEHFDIVFIPAVNPDGIEYTWNVDRLWRKTRQQTNLRYCRGYDLDHAFGFEWDRTGTQNDPCSESYGGEHSFQALEAMRLAEWAKNQTALNNVNFVGLLDLHSYSQQVLLPYSYTCDVDPPNLENLEELAAGIAKAIRLSNGESYSVTSACKGAVTMSDGGTGSHKRVEPRGGSAIDWFYHELRAHFSYQIKLRDTGAYGFLLPKEHIIPTGEEIFDAMKYFGDYLLGNNGIEHLSAAGDVEHHPGEAETKTDAGLEMDGMELRRRKSRR